MPKWWNNCRMIMLTAIMLIVIILTVLILSFNMQRVIYLGFCCDTNYKIVLIKLLHSKLIIMVVIQPKNRINCLSPHMPKRWSNFLPSFLLFSISYLRRTKLYNKQPWKMFQTGAKPWKNFTTVIRHLLKIYGRKLRLKQDKLRCSLRVGYPTTF